MRKFLVICGLAFSVSGDTQDITTADSSFTLQKGPGQRAIPKKWSFNSFQGISAGIVGFNGGRTGIYSVQAGVQATRMLNNNVFAFGAVSIAPTYMNFNRSFINTDFSKTGYNSFQRGNLGLNPRAEVGLGYTNDARTFSISGSISIQQNNYGFGNGYFVPGRLNQPLNNMSFR